MLGLRPWQEELGLQGRPRVPPGQPGGGDATALLQPRSSRPRSGLAQPCCCFWLLSSPGMFFYSREGQFLCPCAGGRLPAPYKGLQIATARDIHYPLDGNTFFSNLCFLLKRVFKFVVGEGAKSVISFKSKSGCIVDSEADPPLTRVPPSETGQELGNTNIVPDTRGQGDLDLSSVGQDRALAASEDNEALGRIPRDFDSCESGSEAEKQNQALEISTEEQDIEANKHIPEKSENLQGNLKGACAGGQWVELLGFRRKCGASRGAPHISPPHPGSPPWHAGSSVSSGSWATSCRSSPGGEERPPGRGVRPRGRRSAGDREAAPPPHGGLPPVPPRQPLPSRPDRAPPESEPTRGPSVETPALELTAAARLLVSGGLLWSRPSGHDSRRQDQGEPCPFILAKALLESIVTFVPLLPRVESIFTNLLEKLRHPKGITHSANPSFMLSCSGEQCPDHPSSIPRIQGPLRDQMRLLISGSVSTLSRGLLRTLSGDSTTKSFLEFLREGNGLPGLESYLKRSRRVKEAEFYSEKVMNPSLCFLDPLETCSIHFRDSLRPAMVLGGGRHGMGM
ncbi:uncharacterized protein LOC128563399 [Nycticebus coucang]|uniref:uncharacterized protein LOC128563399 n=1 Tax=Nycticebus coucang TaxID=9470 RepID=UPI00234CDA54|nr:uncharacterized protein LOC128563399 [Nycticebus coucang]